MLSGTHVGKERVDDLAQPLGLLGKFLRGSVYLGRGRTGFCRCLADTADIGRTLLRTGSRFLHVPADLASRRALLFDRGGNRTGDFVNSADRLRDLIDR